jgi:hypothetical protein
MRQPDRRKELTGAGLASASHNFARVHGGFGQFRITPSKVVGRDAVVTKISFAPGRRASRAQARRVRG